MFWTLLWSWSRTSLLTYLLNYFTCFASPDCTGCIRHAWQLKSVHVYIRSMCRGPLHSEITRPLPFITTILWHHYHHFLPHPHPHTHIPKPSASLTTKILQKSQGWRNHKWWPSWEIGFCREAITTTKGDEKNRGKVHPTTTFCKICVHPLKMLAASEPGLQRAAGFVSQRPHPRTGGIAKEEGKEAVGSPFHGKGQRWLVSTLVGPWETFHRSMAKWKVKPVW